MSDLIWVKRGILEFLWQANRPVSLRDISEAVNLESRRVNMHLLHLRKKGYVAALDNGSYVLTDLGREALGFPRIDKDLSREILREQPYEKSFHFYSGIGRPLGISSSNLIDLCEKIREIGFDSFEFHFTRGDFERWIMFLGDLELAKRLETIRGRGEVSEEVREKIYNLIRQRCNELQRKIFSS